MEVLVPKSYVNNDSQVFSYTQISCILNLCLIWDNKVVYSFPSFPRMDVGEVLAVSQRQHLFVLESVLTLLIIWRKESFSGKE